MPLITATLGDIAKMLMDFSINIVGFVFSPSDLTGSLMQQLTWDNLSGIEAVKDKVTFLSLFQSINTVFVPIGISLATVAVLIEFLRKATDLEHFTLTLCLNTVIKLFCYAFLIQGSFAILVWIIQIGASFVISAQNIAEPILEAYDPGSMGEIVKNMIDQSDYLGFAFISQITSFIIFLLFYGIMFGSQMFAFGIVFNRTFRMFKGLASAPVPIALNALSPHNWMILNYFKIMAALALEGLFMYLAILFFQITIKQNAMNEITSIIEVYKFMLVQSVALSLLGIGLKAATEDARQITH